MARREGRYPKFKHIHIDCDPLVYKVGFACEEAIHITEDGGRHRTMTDAIAYCQGMGLDPDNVRKVITPRPWGEVRTEVRKKLRRYKNLFNPSKTHLYLSPKEYFRHSLTETYKGNRPSNKPYHYDKIREYLMSVGAKMVHGMEADDVVAINHFHLWKKTGNKKGAKDTLIIGEDKDFNNVPGWHYNPYKDKLFFVTTGDAVVHFYRQLISGDQADNIQGIPGKGAKAAEKIIPMNAGPITEKAYWEAAKASYLEYAEKNGIPEEEILDQMMLNAHLLWILWEKEKWFEPPVAEDRCLNLKWLQKIQSLKDQGRL